MSECLLYYIKDGITRVGSTEANIPQDIQLCGPYILNEHCIFENRDGIVLLAPAPQALCYVNGRVIDEPILLRTGNRVILGKHHVFRFNHPGQPRERKPESCPLSPASNDTPVCPFLPFRFYLNHFNPISVTSELSHQSAYLLNGFNPTG